MGVRQDEAVVARARGRDALETEAQRRVADGPEAAVDGDRGSGGGVGVEQGGMAGVDLDGGGVAGRFSC